MNLKYAQPAAVSNRFFQKKNKQTNKSQQTMECTVTDFFFLFGGVGVRIYEVLFLSTTI